MVVDTVPTPLVQVNDNTPLPGVHVIEVCTVGAPVHGVTEFQRWFES
jgi:hypothetical protein